MESYGIPVIEVFRILYLGREKVELENQCGTIKMSSHAGSHYLYKVDEVDPKQPAIGYKDDIVVHYKAPPIDFAQLRMHFDLFDGAYKGSIDFDWDPPEEDDNTFCVDKMRSIYGVGEIAVLSGFYSNATVARIEVKLLDNSAADANVYGIVAASNSESPLPSYVSMLYVKKPDNKTKMGDASLIPLSRSCVGVPLKSKLYVYISLHLDDVVYKSRLEFDALKAGKIKKNVESVSSEKEAVIQVKVTWNADD